MQRVIELSLASAPTTLAIEIFSSKNFEASVVLASILQFDTSTQQTDLKSFSHLKFYNNCAEFKQKYIVTKADVEEKLF